MPRPCQRVRLESGLKLDLNRLARRGLIKPGAQSSSVISWKNNYTGERIASALITVNLRGVTEGWFRIQFGSVDQRVILVPRPCHFGGRQWYFICPRLNRRASVLWMPPGARDFACRQKWGRQVAYVSQFSTTVDRAHQGKARVNSRLCAIGGFDPEDWDFPPKPKWMRWNTYRRAEEKFDRYEAILDEGLVGLVARFTGRA